MAKRHALCTARKHRRLICDVQLKFLATTSYLCVEKGTRITPEAFYDTVKRRNKEFFKCAWGASDLRQGMITLGREFISTNETFPTCADDLFAEAADHSTEVDLTHYAIVHGAVPRLSNSRLAQHRWLAKEWSSLLGMGPRNAPASGTIPSSEKVLDKELATQISEIVANVVMNKLAAIGLTAENVKKLENLGEAPPVGDAVAGPQETSLADAVSSRLTAIGLTEENVKKLATLAGGAPYHAAGGGSQAARTPGPLHSDDDSLDVPSPSLIAKDSFICHDTASMQLLAQRKRGVTPEVITQGVVSPRPRKRMRHNGIDCEKDGLLMEDERRVNRSPTDGSSPLASKMPNHAAENILVQNILHRDHGEDDLLRENIRSAIQKLLRNPSAREKSGSQMEAILLVMRKRQDGLITMRTGGGKSMLWLVPPLLDPGARFIVVCPFTVLLDQQCELAQKHGLRAIKYGAGDIPKDIQILFVQVEHIGRRNFCE